MLYLVTGQPGNGKTLYSFGIVEDVQKAWKKAQPEAPERTVYQSGIPNLLLPWLELDDGSRWHEQSGGAIVVIDECQRIFPPRKQGAQVPKHVSEFETHRHRGFDIILITQHPQLLDIAVRKLVGRHFHVVRKFGRETAKVLQWERCVDPHDRSVQKDALVTRFPFPKERYKVYKSADVHTVKKDFPIKPVAVLVGSLAGIITAFYIVYDRMTPDAEEVVAASAAAVPGATWGTSSRGASGAWGEDVFAERVKGIPYSAPMYQAALSVEDVPTVAGCSVMKIGHRTTCTCTTAQGTVLDLEKRLCMSYHERGAFDPRGKARYPTIEPYVPALPSPVEPVTSAGAGAAAPATPPEVVHQTT